MDLNKLLVESFENCDTFIGCDCDEVILENVLKNGYKNIYCINPDSKEIFSTINYMRKFKKPEIITFRYIICNSETGLYLALREVINLNIKNVVVHLEDTNNFFSKLNILNDTKDYINLTINIKNIQEEYIKIVSPNEKNIISFYLNELSERTNLNPKKIVYNILNNEEKDSEDSFDKTKKYLDCEDFCIIDKNKYNIKITNEFPES